MSRGAVVRVLAVLLHHEKQLADVFIQTPPDAWRCAVNC
jgi:hypothetical protein